MQPFEIPHTADGFASLAEKLHGWNGEVRVVMEHAGRYCEAFAMSMHRAGFFVSAINPLVIHNYRKGIDVRKGSPNFEFFCERIRERWIDSPVAES